ncbi:hypothetical protein Syun_020967 [Stephania yunnanensis]|uniref:Uncharacterized protein n=1 Tax=Stephania yunnanensis TaxID=152371 RepID=A0AAP0IF67_9MAGN
MLDLASLLSSTCVFDTSVVFSHLLSSVGSLAHPTYNTGPSTNPIDRDKEKAIA